MSDPGMTVGAASGPLAGLRVVEFAGLGPAPFACMLLSDMGADVVRIDRASGEAGDRATGQERERDLERFLTFVDAVVAIAITLLVLPLVEISQEPSPRSKTTSWRA